MSKIPPPVPGNGLLRSRCGTVTGKWVVGTVFQDTTTNRLWVTYSYLANKYSEAVYHLRWYYWVKHPCPDLPQSVNGGRIHSIQVPPSGACAPINKGTGWERVWLLDDAEFIIKRRADHDGRKADPGKLGRWLTDDIFQLTRDIGPQDPPSAAGLKKGDLLFRDRLAMEQVGVKGGSVTTWWRRHRLSYLDPSVYGGRLRHLWACQPSENRRAAKVPVSAQKDLEKITAAREALKPMAGSPAGVSLGELAQAMGIGHEETARYGDLKLVFQRFREEVPMGARESRRWDGRRNCAVKEWRCDLAAFRRWLGKRTISKVAAESKKAARGKRAPVAPRRLKKAIAFLQFTLTHGRYGPRLFRRFLAELEDAPYAKAYPPCGLVPAADIKRWAKAADIGEWSLWPAIEALPMERHWVGRRCCWRLTAPVVVGRAAGDNGDGATPAAAGQSARSADAPPAENSPANGGSLALEQTAPTGDTAADARPRWDGARRELWYGNVLVKRYARPAERQITVLAAFEEGRNQSPALG